MSRHSSLAALFVATVAIPCFAQAPRETLVVSQAWLAQHLHDPDLVLFQLGERPTYDNGHIPGARFFDYTALHTLPQTDADLSARHDALEGIGISDNARIVLYGSDEYWSPTTRTMLLLNYVGLSHVQFLDGGLKGWVESGQSLSKDPPLDKKGTLSPLRPQPALIADADFVKAHKGVAGYAIVDARNREFYSGAQQGGPRDHRVSGHIPGALSAPFDEFASGDGHLKSPAEIAALFDKAGVKPGDTVIGYCHVGQQATAMLFAARTLGHPVVLYNGSFQDWVQHGLPVENPSAGKDK
jgi:thiosulfate/3-mercaptopyruvate sulfurtransferase